MKSRVSSGLLDYSFAAVEYLKVGQVTKNLNSNGYFDIRHDFLHFRLLNKCQNPIIDANSKNLRFAIKIELKPVLVNQPNNVRKDHFQTSVDRNDPC